MLTAKNAEALVKRYPRESFYLADKLPAWEMHSEADRGRIFAEQLARAQVEYFDFYLLHSVEDGNIDTYEKYDCFSWGVRMKEEGKIRHFGFSFHGSPDLLKAVLDEFEVEKAVAAADLDALLETLRGYGVIEDD